MLPPRGKLLKFHYEMGKLPFSFEQYKIHIYNKVTGLWPNNNVSFDIAFTRKVLQRSMDLPPCNIGGGFAMYSQLTLLYILLFIHVFEYIAFIGSVVFLTCGGTKNGMMEGMRAMNATL